MTCSAGGSWITTSRCITSGCVVWWNTRGLSSPNYSVVAIITNERNFQITKAWSKTKHSTCTNDSESLGTGNTRENSITQLLKTFSSSIGVVYISCGNSSGWAWRQPSCEDSVDWIFSLYKAVRAIRIHLIRGKVSRVNCKLPYFLGINLGNTVVNELGNKIGWKEIDSSDIEIDG